MLVTELLSKIDAVLIWGLVATALMTIILQGSQSLGFSRLSLPFLLGAAAAEDRRWATVLGYVFYIAGGWLFAVLYFFVFAGIGAATWWIGAIVGTLHGLALLLALSITPHIHPRIASEYDPPNASKRLEPPGFLGLNYGRRTPMTTLLGQVVYGVVLGALLPVG